MHNKSDMLECIGILRAVIILVIAALFGGALTAIWIGESCEWYQRFIGLGETYTCFVVAK